MPAPERTAEIVELDHQNLAECLRELAGRDRFQPPLVSLYLNTNWADPDAKNRARIFFKDRFSWLDEVRRHELHGEDIQCLSSDLEFLNEYVPAIISGAEHPNYDGICVFTSRKSGLRRVYLSQFAFDNECCLGEQPQLRQLARLQDGYQEALVAIVDNRRGRVYEIEMAGIRSRDELSTPVHRRHHAGGWSQMRFQRHVDDQVLHHLKEVAGFLTRVFDTRPPQHVILAGSDEAVGELEAHLPDRVRQKVLRQVRMPAQSSDASVLWTAVDVLREGLRREQQDLVEEVVTAALGSGLGVLGSRGTSEALSGRAVDALCFRKGLQGEVWACRQCEGLSIDQEQCAVCGSPSTKGDLLEEATLLAIRQKAQIHEVEPGTRLDRYGGIGARLRYRI